jgi:tyrosyl-tRNA synthetase
MSNGPLLHQSLSYPFFAGQKSNRELRRLCEQGGASRNDEVLRQPEQLLEVCNGDVFRVGERTWFRVRVLENAHP